jgi:hypothetical protein
VVRHAVRLPCPPAGDLGGHALELAQWHVPEGNHGVAQPLAQGGDRPRAHRGAVALEIDRHEFGERQLRHGRRVAAELGLDNLAVVGERG